MFGRQAAPEAGRADFSGHFENSAFAIGSHAVANVYNGTVIQQFAADTAPRPTRRPPPQRVAPRDPVALLGRETELASVRAALERAAAIGFHGAPGVGKTVLLKHLAGSDRNEFPDGAVFANAGGQALEDLLQWLFTVFWDTGQVVYAPGPLRVGEYLRDVRALVVLDDVSLNGADVERLVDGAPACGFALGAPEPPFGDERALALRGLSPDAAMGVFARVLGRDPAADERAGVEQFVRAVEGLPGFVVIGAQLVRDGVCGAGDLVDRPGDVLARQRLLALPAAQQRLLGLLADLAPAPVPAEHLAGDETAELERLRAGGFVERNSPRYALAGPYDAGLTRGASDGGALELLRRMAAWPERIAPEDTPAVVAALRAVDAPEDVLDAARALVPATIRTARTGAWGEVAGLGLRAARRLGRRPEEALFLHEVGTRLGVVGDRSAAYEALTRARDIRRELGDDDALAVTEHNMRELFGGGPGGPGDDGSDDDRGGRGPRRSLVAGLAALALVGGGATAIAITNDDSPSRATGEDAVEVALDPTAPTIRISSPKPEKHYAVGTILHADYTCRVHGQPAPVCVATKHVHTGHRIDTSAPGTFTFRVHARSEDDVVRNQEVTYTIDPPGTTTPKTTPPSTGPPTGTTTTTQPLKLTLDAHAVPPASGTGPSTLDFSCKRGDTPVAPCTATFRGRPVRFGQILPCGVRELVVTAPAEPPPNAQTFEVDGGDCTTSTHTTAEPR
jgi:hypothetical protein